MITGSQALPSCLGFIAASPLIQRSKGFDQGLVWLVSDSIPDDSWQTKGAKVFEAPKLGGTPGNFSGRSGTGVFLPEWMIDYSNIQPFAFGTPCSVAIAISSFFAAT